MTPTTSVPTIVYLKTLIAPLEHKLHLSETSTHARGSAAKRTQSELRQQIGALYNAIDTLTQVLEAQDIILTTEEAQQALGN